LSRVGYRIVRTGRGFEGYSSEFVERFGRVEPFTRVSRERLAVLDDAVEYVERFGIVGSIVECGVWRGGSMMMAALGVLANHGSRELWIYDTFNGMSEPGDEDVDLRGRSAKSLLAGIPKSTGATDDKGSPWAYASLEDVRRNMDSTGYPMDLVKFVPGKVEDTLPGCSPESIAILRLDTDWYESTKWELEQLVPRMARGGVLLIDDYGHWAGSRRAVDEFVASNARPLFLHRDDYAGRSAVLGGEG